MCPICCRIRLTSHVITVLNGQFRKSYFSWALQADLSTLTLHWIYVCINLLLHVVCLRNDPLNLGKADKRWSNGGNVACVTQSWSYSEIFQVDHDGKGHGHVFISRHHTSSQRNDSLRQKHITPLFRKLLLVNSGRNLLYIKAAIDLKPPTCLSAHPIKTSTPPPSSTSYRCSEKMQQLTFGWMLKYLLVSKFLFSLSA